MKILYIAKKYNYGNPKQGFSYAHFNFYDTLLKMNNKENEVIYFPFNEIRKNKSKEEINKALLEIIYKEKPDLAFFVINLIDTTLLKKEVIKEITKNTKTITLSWISDDHWQFEKFSKRYAKYFNWIATTDPQSIKKYHQISYKNVIKTQYAYNHFLYKLHSELQKVYDVSFIGAAYEDRKKIIEKLKENGINVNCWGQGWPNGRISQKQMFRIFSQSKINLNFSKCSGNFWKELALIFFYRRYNKSLRMNNPGKWLDNFNSMKASLGRKVVKGRIFEILGCGGFLLTENTDDLEKYYQTDREIVCYKNIEDLIEKIRYYLKADKEREEITKAGYQRTMREHTFENRFKEIFKIIGF